MCSRSQVSEMRVAASASLRVSHRLSETQVLSPASASPYRMNPGWFRNSRSIPSCATSASSWNEPFLISYVAMRTCFMGVLLCSCAPDQPGPTSARSERIRSGIRPSLEPARWDRIGGDDPRSSSSPDRYGGRVYVECTSFPRAHDGELARSGTRTSSERALRREMMMAPPTGPVWVEAVSSPSDRGGTMTTFTYPVPVDVPERAAVQPAPPLDPPRETEQPDTTAERRAG